MEAPFFSPASGSFDIGKSGSNCFALGRSLGMEHSCGLNLDKTMGGKVRNLNNSTATLWKFAIKLHDVILVVLAFTK